MNTRRTFLSFIASLPFIGFIPQTKKNIKFEKCGTKESREKLKTIYCSLEAMQDIRNWSVKQVDEVTRREIYCADKIESIYGVTNVVS